MLKKIKINVANIQLILINMCFDLYVNIMLKKNNDNISLTLEKSETIIMAPRSNYIICISYKNIRNLYQNLHALYELANFQNYGICY